MLNDNETDLQLQWIQYNASGSPAWFIDEIFVTCETFNTRISFEEVDRLEIFNEIVFFSLIIVIRTLHNFWECYSGYVEKGNSACLGRRATESHLLMNDTEREARTRVFNILSDQSLPVNNNPVLSCRGTSPEISHCEIILTFTRMLLGDSVFSRLANVICQYST